jgi:DNA-binding YbaB/EbfC family protein
MLREAQQMQARLAKAQEELESETAEGTAGGGAVKVIMTGQQRLQSVEIAPEAVEDIEMLQDLVVAAVNDAQEKIQKLAADKMSALTGGLNIPGLF